MLNTIKSRLVEKLKPILCCCALLVLTACATGKSVNSVNDLIDDGERNTMFVSYDVTMNVTDKHAQVNSTELVVHCGKANRIGFVPECIRVKVPLQGRRNIDGYEYYTFKDNGSKVVQMPYGSFDVQSVRHNVVVGVEHYSQCGKSRFRNSSAYRYPRTRSRHYLHRFNCLPISVDVTARHYSETPQPATFNIGPGKGCYAGHLNLEMTDGKITRYSLEQDADMPSEEALEKLPTHFQQVAKERGFERCVTS